MNQEEIQQLLQDIKDYLHITWDDEKTDKNLTGMIKRGMKKLDDIAGLNLDFTIEDSPRELLFDYVRYANSQALEVWEKNFQSELLSLHLESHASLMELEVCSNEE